MLQFEKALTIEIGDFELEAEETPLTRLMGSNPSSGICSPLTELWKQERVYEVDPHVKDIQIDSIKVIITAVDRTDSLHTLADGYVSKGIVDSEDLDSLAVKIAEVQLEPGEQITINGGNFETYFFNLDELEELLKGEHIWAYVKAETDDTSLHVTGENYTLYITVTASLF